MAQDIFAIRTITSAIQKQFSYRYVDADSICDTVACEPYEVKHTQARIFITMGEQTYETCVDSPAADLNEAPSQIGIYELVKSFSAWVGMTPAQIAEEGAVAVEKRHMHDDIYFFTCACGEPGCAGIHTPVSIAYGEDVIKFTMPQEKPYFQLIQKHDLLFATKEFCWQMTNLIKSLKYIRDNVSIGDSVEGTDDFRDYVDYLFSMNME